MARFLDPGFRKRGPSEGPVSAPTPGATHTEDGWRDIAPARPPRPAPGARRDRNDAPGRDPLANPLLGLAVGVALFLAMRAVYVDGPMPFLYRAFQ